MRVQSQLEASKLERGRDPIPRPLRFPGLWPMGKSMKSATQWVVNKAQVLTNPRIRRLLDALVAVPGRVTAVRLRSLAAGSSSDSRPSSQRLKAAREGRKMPSGVSERASSYPVAWGLTLLHTTTLRLGCWANGVCSSGQVTQTGLFSSVGNLVECSGSSLLVGMELNWSKLGAEPGSRSCSLTRCPSCFLLFSSFSTWSGAAEAGIP